MTVAEALSSGESDAAGTAIDAKNLAICGSCSCCFAQRRRRVRQILRDEPIAECLPADIDQMFVMREHDHLCQLGQLAERFEDALGTGRVRFDENVIEDDRDSARALDVALYCGDS